MKTQFIGYGTFSDFLKALEKMLPVNMMLILETNPGKQGFAFCYSILLISQAKNDETIYFRFVTANYQTIGGQPLGDEHTDRSISARDLTLELLSDFNVRKTVLAMPKTMKYIEGHHDLLRYEKESDLFFVREKADESEV